MAPIGYEIGCHDEGGLCPRPFIYPDYGFQRQGAAVVVSYAKCDKVFALCAELGMRFDSLQASPEVP